MLEYDTTVLDKQLFNELCSLIIQYKKGILIIKEVYKMDTLLLTAKLNNILQSRLMIDNPELYTVKFNQANRAYNNHKTLDYYLNYKINISLVLNF